MKRRLLFALTALSLLATGVALSTPAYAAIGIDANVSTNQGSAKTTVSTPAFSTTSTNELLLALVATDYLSGTNTQVSSVAGGGLTWALVVRMNAQSGSSEIWRAFAPSTLSQVTVTATLSQSVLSSLTVMSFTGVNPSGTNGSGAIGATQSANASKGAPTATLAKRPRIVLGCLALEMTSTMPLRGRQGQGRALCIRISRLPAIRTGYKCRTALYH